MSSRANRRTMRDNETIKQNHKTGRRFVRNCLPNVEVNTGFKIQENALIENERHPFSFVDKEYNGSVGHGRRLLNQLLRERANNEPADYNGDRLFVVIEQQRQRVGQMET